MSDRPRTSLIFPKLTTHLPSNCSKILGRILEDITLRYIVYLILFTILNINYAQSDELFEKHQDLEIGTRSWFSTGSTHFSYKNITVPAGSSLLYNDQIGVSSEIFFRAGSRNFFLKGLVGGGIILSGTLRDKDFTDMGGERINWSDTMSRLKPGSFGDPSRIGMASLDVGYHARPFATAPQTRLGIFAGYTYWSEVADAYGFQTQALQPGAQAALDVVNAREATPFHLAPPGTVAFPETVRGIRNSQTWHGPRLGMDLEQPLPANLKLKAEVALLPALMLHNDDSHFLREMPTPSFMIDGWGVGIQTQIALEWQALDNLTLGLGFRYWKATLVSGSLTVSNNSVSAPIEAFSTERMGGFVELAYTF